MVGFESWSPAIEANYLKRAHCDAVAYTWDTYSAALITQLHRMLVVRMRFLTEFT